MKKYFIVLVLSLIVTGCSVDYDNVVNSSEDTFRIYSMGITDSIKYAPADSFITLRIGVTNPSFVKSVTAFFYSSDNKRINSSPFQLYDDGLAVHGDIRKGDSVYSGKFPLSEYYINGNYRIELFVEDNSGIKKLIATKQFTFDNGKSNLPPVITNLSAPDSAVIGTQVTPIKLTVDVSDPNGLNDIELVFFNSFIPPNGNPAQGNPYKMHDDGINGDDVAGDGKYTIIVQLPASGVTLGIYRWEFQARDRGKKYSDKIIHNIHIL